MNNIEDLKDIVRMSIKNIKCKECGCFPEAIVESVVTFKISCPKNMSCENCISIKSIIDETSINFFSQYKRKNQG